MQTPGLAASDAVLGPKSHVLSFFLARLINGPLLLISRGSMAKEHLQRAVGFEMFRAIHMNVYSSSVYFISVLNHPTPEASHSASR